MSSTITNLIGYSSMSEMPDRKKWLSGFADEMERIEKLGPSNSLPVEGKYLRAEWKFWRETAPKYGFGRTELLPIKKTAAGVAKYVGKYVAKHIGKRLPEDKGARLVRYSKRANRIGIRFTWASVGAFMWRLKLGAFCRVLRLTQDNYRDVLGEWFGRNWVYALRPVIESIKPAEFHPEPEAKASLRHAWIVAMNERERRRHRQERKEDRP